MPLPLLAQVEAAPAATTAAQPAVEDTQMQTPPPVSTGSYPSTPLSEDRSNYLRGGLTFNTAYSDNVLGSTNGHPVSDVSYSIWPTIALDETTARMHWVFSYSPGFTFYQRVSDLNQADQNLGIQFRYRLSPHLTLDLHDTLQKSSNVLNNPDLISSNGVQGNPAGQTVEIVPPVADRLNNVGSALLSYQFSPRDMVGASGSFTNLHYPNPSEVQGLYDSTMLTGSAFYNRRLSSRSYIGANYQYLKVLAYPTGSDSVTETHAIVGFYTFYIKPTLSLSFSGGPQHYRVSQGTLFPTSSSWSPQVSASLGWQTRLTAFALSYSRLVTGGGGLLGAYHSNAANFSVRQIISRHWSAGAGFTYSDSKSVTPSFFQSSQDGHSIIGTASIERAIGRNIRFSAGYNRIHQSYKGVSVIAGTPDTNREFVAISYSFTRPLGR